MLGRVNKVQCSFKNLTKLSQLTYKFSKREANHRGLPDLGSIMKREALGEKPDEIRYMNDDSYTVQGSYRSPEKKFHSFSIVFP